MAILLVGVHGTAEGEHGVVVGDLRGRLGAAFCERPLVELHAAGTHLLGEHAGAGVGLMHDGERSHRWDTGKEVGMAASETRKAIETEDAPAPIGPYSQAVVADGGLYWRGPA